MKLGRSASHKFLKDFVYYSETHSIRDKSHINTGAYQNFLMEGRRSKYWLRGKELIEKNVLKGERAVQPLSCVP